VRWPWLPLVVTGNAKITVMAHATVALNNQPLPGDNTVTAVTNGDSQAHSIILNAGAELDRTNSSECYVGMGIQLNGSLATLKVSRDLNNGDVGPLHITGFNSDNYGLDLSDGSATLSANMVVDDRASISGGTLYVNSGATLTLGINAMSSTSMQGGGHISDQGKIVAHGGLELFGGTLSPDGYSGTIEVDAGNQVWLDGGEIDVTRKGQDAGTAANGQLTINGHFSATAGTILNNVNSNRMGVATDGTFLVNGDVNLDTHLVFMSLDLSNNPTHNNGWVLFQWTGSRTGAFTPSLPAGWTFTWDDVNKKLNVFEP
jgi:hypothetical protein